MEYKVLCILLVVFHAVCARIGFKHPNTAFDTELYERVLNPELCDQQIRYLRSDIFLNLRFIDAGIRLPRGILMGNSVDLGNYYQCLGINEIRDELEIKGKYCMIRVPFNQTFTLPEFGGTSQWDINPKSLLMNEDITRIYEKYERLHTTTDELNGYFIDRSIPENPLSSTVLRLAVCIPKPCSVEQAMTSALFNLTLFGFEFEEEFCRLPNDKPWSTADYIAVVLFSVIGLLTILSTCYDVNHTFLQKRDPKQASVLYNSFSLYTNGKRLTTFSSNPNSLNCLDGIRCIAMLWVIVGHSFITETFIYNSVDTLWWLISAKALWVTVAPFTVDTFLMMTGVLLVYTTVGKVTGEKLLKNLHLFYLNRLLRLFPLLALTVLLQASLLNIMFDGPYWNTVADHVQRCREHWWATLLHLQNYITPNTMCITHSWYIAIDVHLHIASPLVLYWVLSNNKRTTWIAFGAAMTLIYATTTFYIIYKDFPGYIMSTVSADVSADYIMNFYCNSLTRGSPFFVGMIFGYLLHIWKGRKPKIHIAIVLLLWACTFAIFGLIVYFVYEVKQFTWNNKAVDIIMNAYSRSAWAMALGWIVFACVHGYGGPINWFLSLNMWKLPSRISYAMFLLHYPLQFTINSTAIAPIYFSVPAFVFKFLAFAVFTFIVSFIASLVIDGPFSILIKLGLGDGVKKQTPAASLNHNNMILKRDTEIEANGKMTEALEDNGKAAPNEEKTGTAEMDGKVPQLEETENEKKTETVTADINEKAALVEENEKKTEDTEMNRSFATAEEIKNKNENDVETMEAIGTKDS